MADCDLLVIGAGISGLSMAHYAAAAGLDAWVLEQDQRVGGCLHSQRFGSDLADFWLELGAHSSFNSYGQLLAILEAAQALDRLQPRVRLPFRLFAGGAIHSIPSQLHWIELLGAPLRLLGASKTGCSVADYYRRIVGRRNYAAVFAPAFDAVICQPSGGFPADGLFRPRPRRKDVPRGFTLAGGLQSMAEIIAARPGIRVERGQMAQAIDRDGGDFVVRTADRRFTAPALALAVPVAVAASLLQTAFPELAQQLAQVSTATVESLGVALPRSRLRLPPLAGLIGRDEAFYSVVSRDTAPDPAWRGFTFHFRPGVLDEAGQRACVARVLELPADGLKTAHVVSKTNQLPALRVGHGQWIGAVDRLLAGQRLALTGNYFAGVAIEDCVTRSLAEFIRLQREG